MEILIECIIVRFIFGIWQFFIERNKLVAKMNWFFLNCENFFILLSKSGIMNSINFILWLFVLLIQDIFRENKWFNQNYMKKTKIIFRGRKNLISTLSKILCNNSFDVCVSNIKFVSNVNTKIRHECHK